MMKKTEDQPVPFDEAIAQLEKIVQNLESEQLPLEDLLALYQQGAALADQCALRLNEARMRMETIHSAAADAGSEPETQAEDPI